MAFPSFAIFVLAVAGLLALFLPSKQVLLIGIAAAAGIFAEILVGWWTPARGEPGEVYQIRYMLTALPSLCVLAAVPAIIVAELAAYIARRAAAPDRGAD